MSDADNQPLVLALRIIQELGRSRRAAGTDDEAVRYARIADLALRWRQADAAGEIEAAKALLAELQGMERANET